MVESEKMKNKLTELNEEELEKLFIKYDVFPRIKVEIKSNKKGYKHVIDRGKPNNYGLAKLLSEETNSYFFTESTTEIIWRYNNGAYYPNGRKYIKNMLTEILGNIATGYVKREVLGHIEDMNYLDLQDCLLPKNMINLNNGLYDLNTDKLLPHSHKYMFLNKLAVNYDKNAKCPKIMNFFNDVLFKNDMPVIQEWFGFNLYHEHFLKSALMCVGVADTGKSTLLNILTEMLGQKNTSSVTLQTLCDNQFASSELYGKLANICSDISNLSLRQSGVFKTATGRDKMRGEFKFHNPFVFYNNAKLSFSCNAIPDCSDDSDAYIGRWVIVEFVSVHNPKDKETNPNLINELITQEELSGLLNWSIKGLKRLRKNHCFSEHKGLLDVKGYISRNPIKEFIDEILVPDGAGIVYKKDVYNAYCVYCKNKSYYYVADNVFSRLFKKNISFLIGEGTVERRKVWKGIIIKGQEGIKSYDERIKEKKEDKHLHKEMTRIKEQYGV